ncbi:type II toxin-antitoxin system RelE/ParE family toxin [Lentilactobacillus rapi]
MIKKIEPGLFEIRVSLSHGISRSIYFKEIGDRYIITNSFIKKNLRRHC